MKADVLTISKMWYFLGVALFKGELLPVEVGSNSKKISAKTLPLQKKRHGHNFWNFEKSSRQIQENIFFLDLTRGFVKIPKIVPVSFFRNGNAFC